MNLRMSQGQAIRSVCGCSRVTHFISASPFALYRDGSAACDPAHPNELAAQAFARPALAAHHLDARLDLADDRWWAVVDVAGGGDWSADSRFDRPDDLHDPFAS